MPKTSQAVQPEQRAAQTVVLSQRETQMLRALELLSSNAQLTAAQVAEQVGVTRRQLYSWRADPFFRLAEDKMLEDTMSEARARIRAKVLAAVEVLVSALDCDAADRDEAAKWTVRMAAAKALLDRVGVTAETIKQGAQLSDEDLDRVAERIGWLSSGGKAA